MKGSFRANYFQPILKIDITASPFFGGAVNKSVKQKESGREFSEDSLKYTEKFLKTLKIQVVPEVGNSHT